MVRAPQDGLPDWPRDPSRDPARLRIGDEERHQVAEVLRRAAGEGRIELDELEERLEATYAARTYADLVPITADLPVQAVGQPVPAPPRGLVGPAYSTSLAIMSETRRSGPWQVGATHSAVAVMGSVVLDLRQALFTVREVTITAFALMAGVDVVVNPQTLVVCDGVGLMGDFSESRSKTPPEPSPTSPVVRVRGLALMGAVNVKRKPVSGKPQLGRG